MTHERIRDISDVQESTDSGFRRTVLSSEGRTAELARKILDEQIGHAYVQGQRGFNVARAVVCGIFLAREFTLAVFDLENMLATRIWSITVLAVGLVWSLAYLRFVKAPKLWFSAVGAALDYVLFFLIMLGLQLFADPATYRGLWSYPAVHSIALIVAASGLRFNRAIVLLCTALAFLTLGALLVTDDMLHSGHIQYAARDMIFDVLLVIGACTVALVYRQRAQDMAERTARRALDATRARDKLGRYLGRVVAKEALSLDEIKLGGARQNIAVLFTDLRGFTSAAEAVPPEQLVDQLNAYLEEMVRCIESEGGVVDKYTGDGVMAVFGAPHTREDDALRALQAARKMQTALFRHNDVRKARGLWPLEHGIGVHWGSAVAGHVGTADHAQYTVVGDVVNVAARLDGMTKAQGRSVLVSRDLVERARAIEKVDDLDAIGPLPVRGRVQPLDVYALRG
jgi:class 3 adenylate cyclase